MRIPSLAHVLSIALCSGPGSCLWAQQQAEPPPSDRQLVEAAVTDYVRALYDVEPARIERSVHGDLVKLGFGRRKPEDPYRALAMSYAQLVKLAGEWNDDGDLPDDAPRTITVLGVLPRIACAKLVAQWGVDYFHLAKEDGGWRIRQVLWQSHPGEPGARFELEPEQRAAIERAGFDYCEAFYETRPELIERSVHEDLDKFGFYRPAGAEHASARAMTYQQLCRLAETAYAGGEKPPAPRKAVRVLDALDQTALIEIVGEWGIDYAQVAKFDGRWKIRHVIWQSHPRPAADAAGAKRAKHADKQREDK